MRRYLWIVAALSASVLVPASYFLVFGRFEPSAITAFKVALFIALGHVVVLGLPAFLLLSHFGRANVWTSALSGFVIACIPVGAFSWPLRYPEMKTTASAWNGTEIVQTMVDGVPTLAGWLQYLQLVGFFGAFGLVSGLTFWLVYRQGMSPNQPLHPTLRASALSAGERRR